MTNLPTIAILQGDDLELPAPSVTYAAARALLELPSEELLIATTITDDKFSLNAEKTKTMRGGLWSWHSEVQTAETGVAWRSTGDMGRVNVRGLINKDSDLDAMIQSIELAISRVAAGKKVEGADQVEWEGYDLSMLRRTRAYYINEREARRLADIGISTSVRIRQV